MTLPSEWHRDLQSVRELDGSLASSTRRPYRPPVLERLDDWPAPTMQRGAIAATFREALRGSDEHE